MVKSSDGNGDLLPKQQFGCMNGFIQLFDRRLFFIGRSFGSHHHKRLLIGAQQRLEPHDAAKALIKTPDSQKGRTGESLESSEASSLSSSHSSTHSAMAGWKHPSNKGLDSFNIREVVKDSMYNEARGLKHIDSPRPLQRSKGTKNVLPRFSYDGTGRETRDAVKTNMKLKDLPRFSLDSKASSLKHSALEICCQVPLLKKESGGHSRSSSIVTKLMGLDDFPNSITTDESSIASLKVAILSKSPTAVDSSHLKQVSSSQSFSRKNPASQSPQHHKAISVRKSTACSKLPLEPSPWKQQDCSKKQSRKVARKSGEAPADNSFPSSVYGQIEKRIADLEFNRSGKDLRALKQILEAMQKTREKLENQKGEFDELKLEEGVLEDICSDQKCSSLMLQNRKTYQQPPAQSVKVTFRPKQLTSSTGITKLTGKVKISSSSSHDSKYDRENQAYRERANHHHSAMNSNMKDPNQRFPCIDKKITSRNLDSEHCAPQRGRAENCTASGRGSEMMSPRLQYIVRKPERESRPNTSAESNSARTQLSKKVREKRFENGKHRVKSSLSSETRYSSYNGDTASLKSESNNSVSSHTETDAISSVNLFSMNSREHQDYVTTTKQQMAAVELTVIRPINMRGS